MAPRMGVSLRIAMLLVSQELFPCHAAIQPRAADPLDSYPMIIASVGSPGFQLALE